LVVSSKPAARAWLRSALGTAWECDEASDALDALRRVHDEDVDLVVADESTEPYGAFGLTRELKILPYPPGVIIVLDRRPDAWLARWAGADRWLVQPIDPFDLARVASEIIDAQDASVGGDVVADTEPAAPAP
jgi:DNA-binding response OmpR family regulator